MARMTETPEENDEEKKPVAAEPEKKPETAPSARNGGRAAGAPEAKVDVTGKLLDQVTKEKHQLFEKNEKLEKQVQTLGNELDDRYKQIEGLKKALEDAKANSSTTSPSPQDLVANLLMEQTNTVSRHKDAAWGDRIALDRLTLSLEFILELLTPETKIAHSGLVKETEELKMSIMKRSDRIRELTVVIPSHYRLTAADFDSEVTLAEALTCPVKAAKLRDELTAFQPDSADANLHNSFVLRTEGAISILRMRKQAEEDALQARFNQLLYQERAKWEQEHLEHLRNAGNNPATNNDPADAARRRKEEYDRQQNVNAAPTAAAPAPIAIQPAKNTLDEMIEIAGQHYVITGLSLLTFVVALILLFT